MNKLLTKDANCRIKSIDRHVGFVECLSRFVAAGLSADASHLAERAMEEAENYKGTYRDPIPGDVSIERLECFVDGYYQCNTSTHQSVL
jgi:20S proteasome subunit alpha 7